MAGAGVAGTDQLLAKAAARPAAATVALAA